MESELFIKTARELIVAYYKEYLSKEISFEDTYVVWSCKTLQNSKGLFSTNIPDTRYFEVTYNGDKNEIYFDSYTKEFNKAFGENGEVR